MPDNSKTWGDFMAPALKMTSRPARAVMRFPLALYATPTARLPSSSTRSTSTSVTTRKLDRFMAGRRYPAAAEARLPLRIVVWVLHIPSWLAPL